MAQPESIASGYRGTAGPVFSRRGYLLFSDVPSDRILRWEKGRVTVFRENSHGARSNTFDHQGRLLTCEMGRVTRTEKDGKITILASGVKEPADLVYAIDGSVYFSDPADGAVWQIRPDGRMGPRARDCERPFGVALAPNQQRLFVTDRARRQIRVYDIAGNGSIGSGKVFAVCDDEPGGLKTDEAGGVWVAVASGIHRFDHTGKRVEKIALREPAVNCNWGGGFQDLYVTAGASVYRVPAAVKGTRTF